MITSQLEQAAPEPKLRSQAERIIAKFGSPYRLSLLIDQHTMHRRSPSQIYRWTYPREKGGTGGIVPSFVLFNIVMPVARLEGIFLTPADLHMGPLP